MRKLRRILNKRTIEKQSSVQENNKECRELTLDHRLVGHPVADLEGERGRGSGRLALCHRGHLISRHIVVDNAVLRKEGTGSERG